MEPTTDIPFCPYPGGVPSDVLPMLIVALVFLLGGCAIGHWRRKRSSKRKK